MAGKGIAICGKVVADIFYNVDSFPVEGRSTRLHDMRPLVGGMGNIAIQLAKLDPEMPVKLACILGKDGEGDHSVGMLSEYPNIDLSGVTREGTTSTTIVLNTQDTKTRSFLSRPGTSNFFSLENIDWDLIDADVMVLEYLLSLDRCDADDPEFGTHAGRILHEAQSRGMLTAIDFSSRVNERAPHILKSALPHTSLCVMNESECEGTTQMKVTDENGVPVAELVEKALNYMADRGCNQWAVIHAPAACYGLDCRTREFFEVKSLKIAKDEIVGVNGAGDAFCSGIVYQAYQGAGLEEALRFATAVAGLSLTGDTGYASIVPAADVWEFERRMRERD